MYKFALTIKNVPVGDSERCKKEIMARLAELGIVSRNLIRELKIDSFEVTHHSIFTYFYSNKIITQENIDLIFSDLVEYYYTLAVLMVSNDMYCIFTNDELVNLFEGKATESLCTTDALIAFYEENMRNNKAEATFFKEQINFLGGKMIIP